eukprot:8768584-Pyramimonas_sp.AAC.1
MAAPHQEAPEKDNLNYPIARDLANRWKKSSTDSRTLESRHLRFYLASARTLECLKYRYHSMASLSTITALLQPRSFL